MNVNRKKWFALYEACGAKVDMSILADSKGSGRVRTYPNGQKYVAVATWAPTESYIHEFVHVKVHKFGQTTEHKEGEAEFITQYIMDNMGFIREPGRHDKLMASKYWDYLQSYVPTEDTWYHIHQIERIIEEWIING